MIFLNFTLPTTVDDVIICALDLKWDLHNLADFAGMTVANDGAVTFEWNLSTNPYRPQNDLYASCALAFRGLKLLKVLGRDSEMPNSEDLTLTAYPMSPRMIPSHVVAE